MPAASKNFAGCLALSAAALWGFLGATATAQLPFGPPPVEDGYVPVGPVADPRPPAGQLPGHDGRAKTDLSRPETAPPQGDAALVGPRYAPQPPSASAAAAPGHDPRAAQPASPAGPIRYPVAADRAGQVLARAETDENFKVFARVGNQVVLGGEFLRQVDAIMEANRQRIPEAQWETQRLVLIKEILDRMLDNKLVLADALRTIPEANLPILEKQVNEQFEEMQLKQMMAETGSSTRAELDRLLREQGTSLEAQRRIFFERAVAAQWIRQSLNVDKEVTHEEMWRYYQQHREEYRRPAQARWQELHVAWGAGLTREQAHQKISQMGNDVLRGVPFEQVAAAHSQGPTARQGGRHDWTTRGSLRNERIDAALFELPVGRLSPIFTDGHAFTIIRVTEREEEQYKPFRDAQVEIAELLKEQDRQRQIEAYYARLRKEIAVWTIFDDPAVAAKLPAGRR